MSQTLLTLNGLFQNAFYNYSERVALNFKGKKMTYNDLRLSTNRLAHALKNYGVEQNTPVALFMPNCLEYVISLMGLYQSGGSRVALNAMLGENEIAYILKDSGAKVLIVEESFFDKVLNIKDSLPELTTIIGVSRTQSLPSSFISWESVQENNEESDLHVPTSPHDIASISYTGGTTGNPKGVIHSHQNSSYLILTVCLTSDILDDEKMLLTAPLPHATGLFLMAGLINGAEVFVEDKFDIELLLKKVEKEKITFLNMVPTMLYRIIDYMEGKSFDTSSIRTIIYGTAPITSNRLKQALSIFGPVFIQTYGLTETPGAATKLTKEDHKLNEINPQRLLSCGKSTPFCRIKIVDENGIEVKRGEEGEIIVQSLTNMVKYHNLPKETEETLKDGWLYTGDIGSMDEDGYIYILDRKKDMIISGGMNVYSSEVEDVIQKHPEVNQVAVIGIPDKDWGEAVTAFIIPRNPELTSEDIKNWCEKELSKYKRPKAIHFVDSLPLTPYGKIDKKTLRKPYWRKGERQI